MFIFNLFIVVYVGVEVVSVYKRLFFVDWFLFVWIFGVMGIVFLVGYYKKEVKDKF